MPSDNSFIELIVKFSGDIFGVSTAVNGSAEIITCNYAILTIPSDRVEELLLFEEVEYYETAKDISAAPMLYYEMGNVGISPVRDGRFKLRGRGVIVGIIDSGIDYTHREFITPDNNSRILYIWDQSADGIPPNGFIFGVEYDRNMINYALSTGNPYEILPSRDLVGHGTAVAGIAVGNSGIATEASIISVKLGNKGTAKTTDILRGVRYLIDKALLLKMPLVINISYGMNNGSHTGDSLFEECLNSLCSMWKTSIVVAAGNEGGAGHHSSVVLTTGKTEEIEFACPYKLGNLYVDIWKSFNDNIDFELIAPNKVSSGNITPKDVSKVIRYGEYTVTVYYKPITHYSRKQEIIFLFSDSNFMIGIWDLRIKCSKAVDGRVNLWLPTVAEVSANTAFLQPDDLLTITLPATVNNVISVGGYNSLLNSIAFFSGKGDKNLHKPDIVAPAVNIYSSKVGGGFDTFSGTSMAAPFVSGSAALMMDWGIVNGRKPFLYNQMLKGYLIKGATRNKNIEYPDSAWGYGSLNLIQTMELLESDI